MSRAPNAGRQSRVAHLTVAATVAAVINLMAPNAAAVEINDELLDRAAQWQACLQGEVSNEALTRCTQPSRCISPSATAKSGWSRPVRLRWSIGEGHPAWSPSERDRFVDLGMQRLRRLIDSHPGTYLLKSSTVDAGRIADLQVDTQFGGGTHGHRDVTDWIRTPRKLEVVARLAGNTHEVTARVPAQVRPYQGEASDAKWLRSTLEDLERGTASLLREFACTSISFPVVKNPNGKLSLDLQDVRGMRANQSLLLVPLVSRNTRESWPVAQVTGNDPARNPELDIVSGSVELCANESCLAVPL